MSSTDDKVTVLEALMPDVMRRLKNDSAMTDKIYEAVTGKQPIGITGTGNSLKPLNAIALPIAYENLLTTLVSGGAEGVSPFYDRGTVLVSGGTINYLIGEIPPGDSGSIVYVHTMWTDYYTPNLLLTHQSDNDPPIIAGAPLNAPIVLVGAFLRPVQTKITHILVNNDTRDILFTDDVQAVIMTTDYMRSVFNPLMKAQVDMIEDVAKKIIGNKGEII